MKSILALTVISCFFLNSISAEGSESNIDIQALPFDSHPNLNIHGVSLDKRSKKKSTKGVKLNDVGPTPTGSADSSKDAGTPTQDDNPEDNFLYAGIPYNQGSDLPAFEQSNSVPGEAQPPVPQATACKTEGQIAMTFSEGPTNVTLGVANDLKSMGVRGNFFVNVKDLEVKESQDIVRSVYQDGHLIGLTYKTPQEEPGTMTDAQIEADIIRCAEAVKNIIGIYPKYVRLHISAQTDKRTEHIMDKLGFILVSHSLDSRDYLHKETNEIVAEFSNSFKAHKSNLKSIGSFISIQYDIPQTRTSTAMKGILELLKNEHFEPVRMDGCLNDKTPYKSAADKKEYVGDKFSFGTSGYASGLKPATPNSPSASASQSQKESQPTSLKVGNSELPKESMAPADIIIEDVEEEGEERHGSSGSTFALPQMTLYLLVSVAVHSLVSLF